MKESLRLRLAVTAFGAVLGGAFTWGMVVAPFLLPKEPTADDVTARQARATPFLRAGAQITVPASSVQVINISAFKYDHNFYLPADSISRDNNWAIIFPANAAAAKEKLTSYAQPYLQTTIASLKREQIETQKDDAKLVAFMAVVGGVVFGLNSCMLYETSMRKRARKAKLSAPVA